MSRCPLVRLPNGAWIDPADVHSVVPWPNLKDPHEWFVTVVFDKATNRGGWRSTDRLDEASAMKLADDIASSVNEARAALKVMPANSKSG